MRTFKPGDVHSTGDNLARRVRDDQGRWVPTEAIFDVVSDREVEADLAAWPEHSHIVGNIYDWKQDA